MKIPKSTLRFYERAHDMTDGERAASSADKTTLVVLMWEYLRTHCGWIDAGSLAIALKCSSRQARRYMHRLGATGLCKVSTPETAQSPLRIRFNAHRR